MITDQMLAQVYADLKPTYGGCKEDYLGLLYLERELKVPRETAALQVAFGGHDYGIDGFHVDPNKRNLYLFQFKYSTSAQSFKQSFKRLIDDGMQQIFAAKHQDTKINPLLVQLRSALIENESVIDRVLIHFVFLGDPDEAEKSQVLDKLREDLENKKFLIDQRFERTIGLVIEFRSARTKQVAGTTHVKKTHTYIVRLANVSRRTGSSGEQLAVGFAHLTDLLAMYRDMGQRFFERNIRAALASDLDVNRSLQQAFRRIVLDGTGDPAVFPFDHNGVTLAGEALEPENGAFRIVEPRLLNGAQTITTLARFLDDNTGNQQLKAGDGRLDDLVVLCKVVTNAGPAFVTAVTVNNNRQNPVHPWNLRANEEIQLELHDWFLEELGLYYERQEKAFEGLSEDDLEDMGVSANKPIELKRLTHAFFAIDGEIDKFQRFREVFEDQKTFDAVFHRKRLQQDIRRFVLCYKVQFRIRMLVNEVAEKGASKYAYINKARNLLWALLCQGMLNDSTVEKKAEAFGRGLSVEADYTEWLRTLATTRCRFILSDLVVDKAYAAKAAEGNFSFLRSGAAYKRAMEIAYKRYKWVQVKLK
jgi:hypothetical protein